MSEEISADLAPAPKSTQSMGFGTGGIVLRTFDEAWRMAQLLARSDLVPKDYRSKPENCLVAMQMGAELGFKPMQALQGIAVINGRPAVWGDALFALVQSCPVIEDLSEDFDEATKTAICTIKRRNRSKPFIGRFSEADANKAGLLTKDSPWKFYPRRMMQMRARAFAARDAIPDFLKGVGVVEEVQDIIDIPSRPAEPALPALAYDDAAFESQISRWQDAIDAGMRSAEDILAMARSKGRLTDEQVLRIQALGEPKGEQA